MRSVPDLTIDLDHLVQTVSAFAKVPTHVDLGWDTQIAPDHPRLVHYVQEVVRPELAALGYHDFIDVRPNDLVVAVGPEGPGPTVLIQNYTPAQHHNLMREPLSGRVDNPTVPGIDGLAIFGQGVSQVKAHQGVMVAVLQALRDQDIELRGRLYWAVNNEGRSSHARSTAIVRALPTRPQFGIVQHGTNLEISIGNRGRVDLDVHVRGTATHSSAPERGASAIEGANEVINRLKTISWPERHPQLGGRQAIVYKVRYEPLAPHTLPSDAYLTVDRRLLPGDDPEVARQEVETAIGHLPGYEVEVRTGVHMWPSLVDPNHPGVVALTDAHRRASGRKPSLVYGRGTFDAGGPGSLGIPTVMYGASGGDWPTGDDFVMIRDLEIEAKTLAGFIAAHLG